MIKHTLIMKQTLNVFDFTYYEVIINSIIVPTVHIQYAPACIFGTFSYYISMISSKFNFIQLQLKNESISSSIDVHNCVQRAINPKLYSKCS